MLRGWGFVSLVLVILTSGCAARSSRPDVIFFLPGVAGDGIWYDSLKSGLRDGGAEGELITIGWGAPGPLFALNFSDAGVHRNAESKLACALLDHARRFPGGKIRLIGHSAGCGVILGAIAQLPADMRVTTVVLLAPSVSPGYDLSSALSRCDRIEVFVSDRDTAFLDWRTSHFGTYDRVKTRAAGNAGFDLAKLPPGWSNRVVQHVYDPAFRKMGNDGGHFGATARAFAAAQVAPLLR